MEIKIGEKLAHLAQLNEEAKRNGNLPPGKKRGSKCASSKE
jgi:hypothetical protein